ncbi:S8 family serine peptidase [Tropicibacter oceani]|uniref:S8 family serine peptidase n=1 Tax=Tropicibacter oceani TaxID=3058420 RepID=A0ABY8QKD5_9RHOB|nr:S8 family serine peptidase [Tropicibacter oceani]WGW04486.1 S8 family serine peptidase [Tropicibacter oceani]
MLTLLALCLWTNTAAAQDADLRAENALLRARIAQLEALLAEGQSCRAAPAQGDVGALIEKLGAQEEAHAWAILGLSDAPLILPDSVLTAVVPQEYLLLTDQAPEVLGIAADQVLYRYDLALTGFAARLDDGQRDALRASGVQLVENGRIYVAGSGDAAATATPVTPSQNVTAAVDVYLLDTGIRAGHRSLQGRVAAAGFTTFDNGIAAEDCSGHGTHVAARIAGHVLGVSDKARLISVKVMDAFGGGDVATVIKGIDWVMSQPRGAPAVVNMSLTRKHPGGIDPLAIAVTRLMDSGAVVVVAAGNASQDVAQFTPANIPGVITVGSVTDGQLSSFSNAGAGVDLYAPGEAVTSASIRDVCGLRQMSGTSMAAPFVTGLVAELLAQGQAPDTIPDALRQEAKQVSTGALTGETLRFVLSDLPAQVAELCPDP